MTIADDRHPFEDGDFVTFSDIRGMVELNNCPPRRIHVLGNQQFTIGDTSSFSPYESFGWCTKVKQPRTLSFRPLAQANLNPGSIAITDFGKEGRALMLHIAVLALDRFVEEFHRPPRPWDENDASAFESLCEEVNQSLSSEVRVDTLDSKVLRTFAMTCCGDVCPVTCAFGGVAAQEVLKACGGKFTPICQFLFYDALEALPVRSEHGLK